MPLPGVDPAVGSSSGRLRNSCRGREPVWEEAARGPTPAMHTDTVKVA